MGKTASAKRSVGPQPSRASNGADAPGTSPAAEPAEPIERARLQAEVARQRVRIAKEELKRARKRVKEAKREARRARKQADVTRKAWKKARKAHRAKPTPETPAEATRVGRRKRQAQAPKGSARGPKRKSTSRRRATKAVTTSASAAAASEGQADGGAPVTNSSET